MSIQCLTGVFRNPIRAPFHEYISDPNEHWPVSEVPVSIQWPKRVGRSQQTCESSNLFRVELVTRTGRRAQFHQSAPRATKRPSAAIAEGRHYRNGRLAGLPRSWPENCSEKCSYGILKVHQGSTGEFRKPLKTQGKLHRVFTGDPLIRRQIPATSGPCLRSRLPRPRDRVKGP